MKFPTSQELSDQIETQQKAIRALLKQYSHASIPKSVWQIINTLVPFFLLWAFAAYVYLNYAFWPLLLITPLAAGFMVRAFIIFHDCCHGSFFQSKTANDWLGRLLGVIVFTPYEYWKHSHSIHHASAGDLDKRGVGDVSTWTVDEYRSKPWYARLGYRLMRQPLFLFTAGPLLMFVLVQRIWRPGAGQREKLSVIYTNLALVLVVTFLIWLVGWKAFLVVQLPILWIATVSGVWLFYVQHNFEGTYWERHASWNFYKAGLLGSSYYQLPALLNWFTGNIGFHHIHHLAPKIPNYYLPRVHFSAQLFQQVRPLTIARSLKSLGYRLWDEERKVMVGFNVIANRRASASLK